MILSKEKSIYYDDVNLLAQNCGVESRKNIPKDYSRIIVSPMTSVAGQTLIKESIDLGLTVCVHRFQSLNEQISSSCYIGHPNLFYAIGLNDYDRISFLMDHDIHNFILDIANGYMTHQIEETIKYLSQKGKLKKLMLGNVHTKKGFDKLAYLYKYCEKGNSVYIRVGIGNGHQCTTKIQTGYNRGQITEIEECNHKIYDGFIVADGGIKTSGDAVKAFGVGAEYIMLGSLLGNAEEAECHIKGHKKLFGGASKFQAQLLGKKSSHHEGRESDVIGEIKPLEAIMREFWGGIASGVSYSGYSNLTDFIGNGHFELKAR